MNSTIGLAVIVFGLAVAAIAAAVLGTYNNHTAYREARVDAAPTFTAQQVELQEYIQDGFEKRQREAGILTPLPSNVFDCREAGLTWIPDPRDVYLGRGVCVTPIAEGAN